MPDPADTDRSASVPPDLAPPAWFTEACSRARGRYGSVTVDGAEISYQAWGSQGARPLLLLHGSGASSEWWEPTAVLLADRYHVVAPSFAGCGRSTWRESYCCETWIDEALACAKVEHFYDGPQKPACVAHSFGAEAGVRLANQPGPPIAHLALIDSMIGLHIGKRDEKFTLRDRQFYADRDVAAGKFSTLPRDNFGPAWLRHYVAAELLEPVEREGRTMWTWRADPNVMRNIVCESAFEKLATAGCPIDFIYGGCSTIYDEQVRALQESKVPDGRFVKVDGAGHHVPLDTPQALAVAIDEVLSARH